MPKLSVSTSLKRLTTSAVHTPSSGIVAATARQALIPLRSAAQFPGGGKSRSTPSTALLILPSFWPLEELMLPVAVPSQISSLLLISNTAISKVPVV